MTAGYSATPLAKKLGYRPAMRALWLDAPTEYPSLLAPLPEDVTADSEAANPPYDLVHLFVTALDDLDRALAVARAAMKTDGAIWVSWYKQSAKIPTDVTENAVRARALATDLVDVKVCAVSDLWSGLRLVIRKALR